MELKTTFMAFFVITTLVSFAYPNLGQEDIDNKPLVNPGPEMDAVEAISPASQEYNMYILESLPPKSSSFIEYCMDKMGPDYVQCNEVVIEEILTNKPISRECCLEVVKAGKECYLEIRKLMFQFYQLKRFASQVSFRTNKVWERCSAEVESPSSSHDIKRKLS